ncbi:MAG: hypothetical protein P4M11_07075 [Candidatus Pacebacteria bacterium]|nr:hypothetical protein [Candidatus Paceibacterota bacterium]
MKDRVKKHLCKEEAMHGEMWKELGRYVQRECETLEGIADKYYGGARLSCSKEEVEAQFGSVPPPSK